MRAGARWTFLADSSFCWLQRRLDGWRRGPAGRHGPRRAPGAHGHGDLRTATALSWSQSTDDCGPADTGSTEGTPHRGDGGDLFVDTAGARDEVLRPGAGYDTAGRVPSAPRP